MVDYVVDGGTAGHRHDLRHVHDGTAADCHDAVIVEFARIRDEFVDHHIGRLLRAVLVDKNHVRTVRIRFQELLVDHFDADQQVLRSEFERCEEFLDRIVGVDVVGADRQQFHDASFPKRWLQPRPFRRLQPTLCLFA